VILFDIETVGLPEEQLRELYVEKTYEEFASSCDQRWKEETKQAKYEESKATAWQTYVDKAALSPITGRVLAIGFASDKGAKVEDGGGDEAALLSQFWGMYAKSRTGKPSPRKMLGWNIHGFDLPFLIRRSWLHGVAVPSTIRDANDRYWDSIFVDLMQRFSAGEWKSYTGLGVAAKFFGVGDKPEGITGKDFGRLWLGTEEEREQARAYLLNDLAMTREVGLRMGVVI
jgi:hypothetical protein